MSEPTPLLAPGPNELDPTLGTPEGGGRVRNPKLVLGAVAGVAALGVAGFLAFSGGSSPTASPTVPHLLRHSGLPTPSASPSVVALPATFSGVLGRDPFKALVTAPLAQAGGGPTGAGTPTGGGTTTVIITTSPAPTTPPTTPPVNRPTVAPTPTPSPTATAPAVTQEAVTLLRVYTKSGVEVADLKVEKTTYAGVPAGVTFGGHFAITQFNDELDTSGHRYASVQLGSGETQDCHLGKAVVFSE